MATYEEMLQTELQEGESVIKQQAGDCWQYVGIFGSQLRGRFFFTQKRIIFYYCLKKNFEIFYEDIESVELCNVGGIIRFVPTGIKVNTKDGKSTYLSVMKRDEYKELIEQNMKAI